MSDNLPIPRSSSPSGPVTQSGNQAGGSIAGRDVNIFEVKGDYIHPPTAERISKLGRLYSRLRDDVNGDRVLSEYISQLQIYTRVVDDETVIGLDGKLTTAERQDQLDMAKAMKEFVYGQLRQHMFSETFQTIYATLMAKVVEAFQTWARPAIISGRSRAEIDEIIHTRVVAPLVAELESCSDYDGIAIIEVRGILYFLTGNCHICWH